MRTALLAKLCPFFVLLAAAPAALGKPATASQPSRSLLLPATAVKVSGSSETRARQTLWGRAPELASVVLDVSAVHSLAKGRKLVRFAQTHDGIPVLSRGAAVLLDEQGEPTRFATAKVETRFAPSSQPALSAAAVAKTASQAAWGASFSSADARLAWMPRGREARLVWVFYQGVLPGTPRSPVVLVDAQTGRVAQRFDATRFDRAASVYEQNPVSTPALSNITLDALASGATKLENERLHSLTCVDKQSLVGKWQIHACEFEAKALADAQGDFPYTFSSDTDPEDAFAEVSMFYHANKAYSFFEGLGMPELLAKPLTTVANLRFPQGWDYGDYQKLKDTSLPLEPYDNAFFTPENPFPGLFTGVKAGLFFGQGTAADFAYDGDVVYHEFGHAMVDRTINLGVYWHLDEQGAAPTSGAMNEALADYFSSAMTGDAKVGEYAAKNVSYGYGDQVIRNLENTDSCPKNLAGEVHIDSTIFSGALWAVRKSLPEADRPTFDQALLTALIGAPSGDVGFEDVADLFATSLEASSLGTAASDALKKEFEERGVLPRCERVLEYQGKPLESLDWKLQNAFFSAGRVYAGFDQSYPYAPGLFQAHLTLPEDAEQLKVYWDDVYLGPQYDLGQDAEPYTPAVLVRFDETPISFEYDNGISTNAGDPIASGSGSVTLDVPKGATDAWVMIVNQGDEMGAYRSLQLTVKSAKPAGTGGTGTGGFGGAGLGGTGGNPAAGTGGADGELTPAGGCACSTGPSRSDGAWAALALFGLALAARKRSR